MLIKINFNSTQALLRVQALNYSIGKLFYGLLIELILNSYKVVIIFSAYHRMREKWISWVETIQQDGEAPPVGFYSNYKRVCFF